MSVVFPIGDCDGLSKIEQPNFYVAKAGIIDLFTSSFLDDLHIGVCFVSSHGLQFRSVGSGLQ
jgi:hypothetical protein